MHRWRPAVVLCVSNQEQTSSLGMAMGLMASGCLLSFDVRYSSAPGAGDELTGLIEDAAAMYGFGVVWEFMGGWLHVRRADRAAAADRGLGDNDSWVGPDQDQEQETHAVAKEGPALSAWRRPRCVRCSRTMRGYRAAQRHDGYEVEYACDGCGSRYVDRGFSDGAPSMRDVWQVGDPAVMDALSLLMVNLVVTGPGVNRALIEESRSIANMAIALCDALGVEQRGSAGDRLLRCVAAIKTREAAAAGTVESGQMRVGRGARVRVDDPMGDRVFAGFVLDSVVLADVEEVEADKGDWISLRDDEFQQMIDSAEVVPEGSAGGSRLERVAVDVVCAMVRSDLVSRLMSHVYQTDPKLTDEEIAERVDLRIVDHAVKLSRRLVERMDAELSQSPACAGGGDQHAGFPANEKV